MCVFLFGQKQLIYKCTRLQAEISNEGLTSGHRHGSGPLAPQKIRGRDQTDSFIVKKK